MTLSEHENGKRLVFLAHQRNNWLSWSRPSDPIHIKPLYDAAVELLSVRGVTEVIGLCGYYTMVSMTLNTFEFELPAGEASELA